MSDTDDGVVGANVSRLRKRAGLSQTALALAMREAGQTHWRQNTVSRVETGRQSLNVGEFRALSEILGNVLEGTPLGDRLAEAGRSLVRNIVAVRLRNAETALGKVETALAQALDEVRTLRYVYDDAFSREHPEYGETEV